MKNQLRVGNTVWHVLLGHSTVQEIRNDGISIVNPKNVLNGFFVPNSSLNRIEYLPLTEEILLKAGFKPQDNSAYTYWYYKYALWSIRQEGNGMWQFCIIVRDDEIWKFDAIIEHVHQLQNLYFALTNQELTINL